MAENAAAPTGGEEGATATLLKAKTKAVKAKVKTPIVATDSSNVLLVTAQQIENMTKEQALEAADKLFDESGMTDFRLGGVLAVIQSNGWYEGYDTFRSMLETKYALAYRKAMYLISNYTHLVEHQIPWDKVKDIGWTKLTVISPILTPENTDHWVSLAKSLTTLQLQEQVKAATSSGEAAKEGETVTSTVTTLTFKVHPDQKDNVRQALDKCKAETNTEFDTVALNNICLGYLGGSVNITKTGSAAPSLQDVMKGHSYEEVLSVFEQIWPDVNLTVQA